jgi:tetratricopeptide (TPR) repeat protein
LTRGPSGLLAAFALALAAAPARPPGPADRQATIAALHRRASASAPGTPEAQAVAGAMAALAREDLDAGRPGPAAELLGEAYTLDEDNGLVLAELTLAHLALGDAETSRFYLRRAEGRVSAGPPEVFAVLGDAYERLHRLDDAIAAWEAFARFGGQDPEVLTRLRRARDELAAARGQRSRDAGPFRIFADPAVDEETVAAAADALSAAYAAQSTFFETELPAPQIAVLYAGRAYFSLVSVPDWVTGAYDGKIRVSADPGGADGRGVLTHELAHAFVRYASGDRAPAWLHEGLAQWLEGRRMPRSRLAALLGTAGPAPSLASLDARFAVRRTREEARVVYAQALSLVEHVVRVRGEGALVCVVRRLRGGEGLDEALRAETGMRERELFREWMTESGSPR